MSAVIKQHEDGIRRMAEDDLDEIMAIEESIYQFPWTRGIFRDCLHVGYYCVVLQLEGRVEGYAILSLAANEAHILTICVNPGSQGKGFGRSMMEHLLEDVLFDAPDLADTEMTIDATVVNDKLKDIKDDEDLSRYIL